MQSKLKTIMKTTILPGVILPSLVFLAYGILIWGTDMLGAVVLTDIFISIPITFLVYLFLQKIRSVERKTMPKRYVAAMIVLFIIVVCVPTQLMSHAQANTGGASGLAFFPKSLITAPILEEIAHRGLIFGISRMVLGFWPATAVSAFWFQFAHITPEYAIITIPVTLTTAGIYEMTGNLKYNMLLHSVFNFVAIFFVNIHIPRMIAIPLYAVSMALIIFTLVKRDVLAEVLCIRAKSRRADNDVTSE